MLEPCGDIDAVAEHIAFIDDHVADIDADAKANALALGEIGVAILHPLLQHDGAAHGIDHRGELDQDAVAGCLEDASAVLRDQRIDQFPPVAFERRERAFLVRAHEP
ncbi:MAG TPA: hypothetical protein VM755_14535 [Stellaceae bacterium]|nr:hypothetical protein [Stellaceae bacterium]